MEGDFCSSPDASSWLREDLRLQQQRKIIDATKLIYIDTNYETNSYIDHMSTLIGSEWCST